MQKELVAYEGVSDLSPGAQTITDLEEWQHCIRQIHDINSIPYNVGTKNTPTSNPVSISREQIPLLTQSKYLVGLKADGVRYLLLLTTYNGEHRALMIDRAQNVYDIEVWGDADYFEQQTLLDGELVWEREGDSLRLLYLVFDAVQICGQKCSHMSYEERLTAIRKMLLTDHPPDLSLEDIIMEEHKIVAKNNPGALHLTPKKFVQFEQGNFLWKNRDINSYINDGLIFVPNKGAKSFGTDYTQFKYKTEHTVDILISNERIALLRGDCGFEPVENVQVGGSDFKVELSENTVSLAARGSVFECLLLLEGKIIKLLPVKVRKDRSAPNHRRVFSKTLLNVLENISVDEIFAACA